MRPKLAKSWRRPLLRGMTLFEITAAAAMLAVLLASSVQVMRVLTTQQLSAGRRAMALQAVQALTEELANTPWDKLTPDVASQLTIPAVVHEYLPSAALWATVTDEQEPVVAKRLHLELRWQDPSGQQVAPLRLTTWVYPDETLASQ